MVAFEPSSGVIWIRWTPSVVDVDSSPGAVVAVVPVVAGFAVVALVDVDVVPVVPLVPLVPLVPDVPVDRVDRVVDVVDFDSLTVEGPAGPGPVELVVSSASVVIDVDRGDDVDVERVADVDDDVEAVVSLASSRPSPDRAPQAATASAKPTITMTIRVLNRSCPICPTSTHPCHCRWQL